MLCRFTLNFYSRTTSLVDALYWINDTLNCLALAIISELYYLACCSFWSMTGFSSLTVWRIMCESVQVINLRHLFICYNSTTRSLPRAARRDIYYRGMTPIYYGCATSDQFLTCMPSRGAATAKGYYIFFTLTRLTHIMSILGEEMLTWIYGTALVPFHKYLRKRYTIPPDGTLRTGLNCLLICLSFRVLILHT